MTCRLSQNCLVTHIDLYVVVHSLECVHACMGWSGKVCVRGAAGVVDGRERAHPEELNGSLVPLWDPGAGAPGSSSE